VRRRPLDIGSHVLILDDAPVGVNEKIIRNARLAATPPAATENRIERGSRPEIYDLGATVVTPG